ncbi:sperm-associated antigen 5 [Hyperolius riggenbachi]|uniref:sperm-associated antigen 5 n=1 Tax=Hyperolius riggenbachi TaxID=752182 RepID=UPI0035A2BD0A
MWSPASPVSNENDIRGSHGTHRKSVGRTLGALDPNSLNNQRLPLPKRTSNTGIPHKEHSAVGVSTSISIWVDPGPDENSKANMTMMTQSYCQNNAQSALSLDINQSKVIPMKSASDLNKDGQCGKLCDPELVAGLVYSNQTHETAPDNQDINCHNADCHTAVTLPSHTTEGQLVAPENQSELNDLLESTNCQKGVSSDTCIDDCNGTAGGFMERSEQLKDHVKSALLCDQVSSGLQNTPFTMEREACLRGSDEITILSGSCNEESSTSPMITPHFSNESGLFSISGEILDLIKYMDILGIEESFSTIPALDLSPAGNQIQSGELDQSLPADIVNGIKNEQIEAEASAGSWATVVLDRHDSVVSRAILCDESLGPLDAPPLAETTSDGSSSLSIENTTHNTNESANKCCFPTVGSTPNSYVSDQDCIKVADEKPPTDSNFNLAADPASTNCNCPTPIIPTLSAPKVTMSRQICNKMTPRVLACTQDAGTFMTPTSTCDESVWTTPVMLLNKSMNTSWNLKGKGERSAKDNACETDSLLWNFSKESFCNASREELISRLEGTLIVVEVLSRQIQGWQQIVSSKPSEQRDVSSQTFVTHDSKEEKYYHSLYLKTLSKLQSLQCCYEQEKHLQKVLKEATESLASYKGEADLMVTAASNLYEAAQQDKADVDQKVKCMQALVDDYMTSLSKMSDKIKEHLAEKSEMELRMEKAIVAKEAADQCLKDLQIHSSTVISQLRQDLESERRLCKNIRECYEQQASSNEALEAFVHKAVSACYDLEEDRRNMRIQCCQATELMSQHWQIFNLMTEKTEKTLQDYTSIVHERDMLILETEQMSCRLEDLNSQNEQTKLENSRLGSELETLMERVCSLESEIEQWKEENSELGEKLSAKDSSLKLVEKELNEATARGHEYHDQMKYLSTEVVPSLKFELSDISSQKEALQTQVQALKKEHAAQITFYIESLEFLEQENIACREQMTESESLLNKHHLTLLERNYQCENLKDTIKDLEKELAELKQKLADLETEAQRIKTKMDKEMSDSSNEISKIKQHLLSLIKHLKERSQREVKVSLCEPRTPGGSLALSSTFREDSDQTTILRTAESENWRTDSIWSEKSAFTVVQPANPSAGTPEVNLAGMLQELSGVVSDVVTASSHALDAKQEVIEDLKMDMSSLKEALRNERFQYKSDVRDLQEEADRLNRRNSTLDEKLTSTEKYIRELQELLHQHEQKILQQLTKINDTEAIIQENASLKLSLKLQETEVEVVKSALAQNTSDAARNWIEEKLMLQKDLTALSMKLADTEYSKSEAIQRLMRHKDILTANLARSDAEVRKLDDIIEKIRMALHSIPDVVNQCDTLMQLLEFLN